MKPKTADMANNKRKKINFIDNVEPKFNLEKEPITYYSI